MGGHGGESANVRKELKKAMANEEIIEEFEQGRGPCESFHHADHIRVAFAYLSQYPVLEALQKFCAALQRFAAAQGKPGLYHETITWAYSETLASAAARATFLLPDKAVSAS